MCAAFCKFTVASVSNVRKYVSWNGRPNALANPIYSLPTIKWGPHTKTARSPCLRRVRPCRCFVYFPRNASGSHIFSPRDVRTSVISGGSKTASPTVVWARPSRGAAPAGPLAPPRPTYSDIGRFLTAEKAVCATVLPPPIWARM